MGFDAHRSGERSDRLRNPDRHRHYPGLYQPDFRDQRKRHCGHTTSAASLGLGNASMYGGAVPANLTKTVNSTKSFDLSTPFDCGWICEFRKHDLYAKRQC
jgi:hypothetical protein